MIRALAILLALAVAQNISWGCSIPVFRYALDRWTPDNYVLEVSSEALHDPDVASQLRNLGDRSSINLALFTSERNSGNSGGKIPGKDSRLWFPEGKPLEPGTARPAAEIPVVWSGKLDSRSYAELIGSPARSETARLLVTGASGVWAFLASGSSSDAAELTRLEKRLGFLKQVAVLPTIDPADPANRLGPGPPLRVDFPVLRIAADDQRENVFRQMLRGPGAPSLHSSTNQASVAALVFGRGRVLGAWPLSELNDEAIDEACLYLLGACSCQVKNQNPGWDLLLSMNWDDELLAVAEKGKMAGPHEQNQQSINPAIHQSTQTNTVRIEPPAPESKSASDGKMPYMFWGGIALLASGALLAISFLKNR